MSRSLPAALALSALIATPAFAAPKDDAAKIVASPAFKAATAVLDREHDRTVQDIITLTEIPAPPFKEEARGKAYKAMLEAHGLTDVEIDAEGNVMGLRKGTKPGPLVVVSAHLDTVFPEGTNVTVRRDGTKLFAPGVADDTHNLAVLLAWIRALDAAKIKTQSDILFVGTVGEEGAGDLRGVRYFFTQGKYKDRTKAFFSVDGLDPSGITHVGVGSKRYRVTFNGPGGHSYGSFGIVNPMAAMGKAIADFYLVQVPTSPKVTYSASVTGGGTSVNAIPNKVFTEFDMRSADAGELAKLDARFQEIMQAAVEHENKARSTRVGAVSVEIKPIGDRPAGQTAKETALVAGTAAAITALGYTPQYDASSTDANAPMALGIPAVTIGGGGTGGRAHSLDEWIDVEKNNSVRGMSVGLAAVLVAAGVN
ncbi:peptidase M20 [Phenylobacterium sp. Root77]|uniref:M20/M25/M40 family metallo-hydrolase n=1 Tax=unclassified Phenylobacterium TaxID=2640670 RepID=UPI0006FBED64|nr:MULTISPECIES: M20/M25/M40 family metallo-hydrolase [unclassified Phenylobacterium]KQW71406.1 peptidase M20 [Phenylobacterium sp. Root1277]KQW94326.1 peptidase M20 [Phenylobacterium sp. Root1290]KRC44020.1 peptidase M20 [Phenylobacterium sp. Root77]